jgi:transcriptional regulator with XRE-family HTH domain
MTKTDFADWLQSEMDARGLRQADLARLANLHTGHLSKVLSRERNPGVEFCRGIARAFGMTDIQVLEIAGLAASSETPKYNPIVESTASMLNDLSEEDQEDFRAMVRSKWERTQRKKPRRSESKS